MKLFRSPIVTTILAVFLFVATQVEAATFRITPLSQQYQQMLKQRGLWKPTCPVSLDRLRDVTVSYYGFDHKSHNDGHLIVLDAAAPSTVKIFKKLHRQHFPMNKIKPTSDYNGSDDRSMEDNNTSSYNCRPVTGKKNLFSIHSYGLSFDINPIQNPYISFKNNKSGNARVLPYQGIDYVNRYVRRPGMIEPVVKIFRQNGFFVWLGERIKPIDYQHFQPPRWEAQLLAAMNPNDALVFFGIAKRNYMLMTQLTEKEFPALLSIYKKNPKRFLRVFQGYLLFLKTHKNDEFIEKLRKRISER